VDPIKFADYHLWANDRVRGKLVELTEAEYCRDLIPPLDSIKNHVIHSILAVAYNLRVRVNGKKADPYEIGDAMASMSIQEAMQHWEKIDRQLVDFASTHLDLDATFPNFLGEGEEGTDNERPEDNGQGGSWNGLPVLPLPPEEHEIAPTQAALSCTSGTDPGTRSYQRCPYRAAG